MLDQQIPDIVPFLKDPNKRVLLIQTDDELLASNIPKFKIPQHEISYFYIDDDVLQKKKDLSSDILNNQNVILIISGFFSDLPLCNMFSNNDILHGQNKIIIIYNYAFLHPTLNHSIYFAPIKNGRIQKHLLLSTKWVSHSAKKPQSENMPLKLTVVKKTINAVGLHEELLRNYSIVNDIITIQMLADRVQQDSNFKAFLFKLVYASSNEEKASIAAANAITVLNYARVPFSGLGFSGVRIAGADLSGALLDHTIFSNAILKNVNLRNAFMRATDFSNCDMTDINFGETPDPGILAEIVRYHPVLSDVIIIGKKSGDLVAYNIKTLSVIHEYHANFVVGNESRLAHDNALCFDLNTHLNLIASGNFNGKISIWHMESGDLRNQFDAHHQGAYALVFSNNSKFLISAGADGLIKFWDMNTCTVAFVLEGHTTTILSLTVDPLSNRLASSDHAGQIFVWDLENKSCVQKIGAHPSSIWLIKFDHHGRLLSVGEDAIKHWDLTNHDPIRVYHSTGAPFLTFALSGDAQKLAAGSTNGLIQVFQSDTGKLIDTRRVSNNKITTMGFSLNSERLVLTDNQSHIKVVAIDANKEMDDYKQHVGHVNEISLSRDGNFIASASSDNTIRIWNIISPHYVKHYLNHRNNVSSVCFGPDGLLVSGGFDKKVILQNFHTGIQISAYEDDNRVNNVCISPNGVFLAYSTLDNYSVVLIHRESGVLFRFTDHKGLITKLCFSPDSEKLVSVSQDKTVKFWRCYDGELLTTLNDHKAYINCALFTPDSQFLITAGGVNHGTMDFEIRFWNCHTYECSSKLSLLASAIEAMAISPDSRLLALAYATHDNTIVLYDIFHKLPVARLTAHPDKVMTMVFSKNNQLVTGCRDNVIRIWNLIQQENKHKLILQWSSGPSVLYGKGAIIKEAQGLSPINNALLAQIEAGNEKQSSDEHERIDNIINEQPSSMRNTFSQTPALPLMAALLSQRHRSTPTQLSGLANLSRSHGAEMLASLRALNQRREAELASNAQLRPPNPSPGKKC